MFSINLKAYCLLSISIIPYVVFFVMQVAYYVLFFPSHVVQVPSVFIVKYLALLLVSCNNVALQELNEIIFYH